ncbi:MAG: metallophosphoesterase [Eubacteriaceae bacterium]|nr:metallophosphoesterase [Eubacteriaceae bacterium]
MMLYVTGDVHIPIDIQKLNCKMFAEQKDMTKDDYVIICGDFGGVWRGSNEEKYWLEWLNDKNFTTLFVDGNHENFHMLYEYPVENFNGGKTHRIRQKIYHLMRGQIFELCGKKIFTMGGAASTDRAYRVKGLSWWEEELPSAEEYEQAVDNLTRCGYSVDYVITHCIFNTIQRTISDIYKENELTDFLEKIHNELLYKKWFFGHYHTDMEFDERHMCLYNKILRVE